MLNCPDCEAELTELDLTAGDCPFCGTVFDVDQIVALDQSRDSIQPPEDTSTTETPLVGGQTVDERAGSSTLDATSLPADSTDESVDPMDESKELGPPGKAGELNRTGDSDNLGVPPIGHQTVDERAASSTVDATSLPVDDTEQARQTTQPDPGQRVAGTEPPESPPGGKTIDQRAGSSTVDATTLPGSIPDGRTNRVERPQLRRSRLCRHSPGRQ